MTNSSSLNDTPFITPLAVHSTHLQRQRLLVCAAVFISLTLLMAAITIAVVIYCLVRKRHIKQTSSTKYRPLPQEDSYDALSKALGSQTADINLPFPPRVQMTSSKPSGIQPSYTRAGQINTGSEMTSSDKFQSRYPFTQHHRVSSGPAALSTQKSARPKKGKQYKRERGKRSQTAPRDSSSTTGEEGSSQEVSPVRQSVHSIVVPAHHLPGAEGGEKSPKVYLKLHYTDTQDIIVRVEQVESLPLRSDGNEVDAYVRVYFTPTKSPRKTSKTKMRRRSSAPVFDEDITFSNMNDEEMSLTTLYVEALDYKSYGKHVLLGRAELAMKDVDFGDNGQVHVSLPLIPPPQVNESNGTVLLSLCFDPEIRKLSLIVLRAKDLNNNRNETDPVAKVTVELKGRLLCKLRTKKNISTCSPIFNEAVSCTVGMENIHSVNVTLVILNEHEGSLCKELGRITLGTGAMGELQRHWNDVVTSPGTHIAEWHELYTVDASSSN